MRKYVILLIFLLFLSFLRSAKITVAVTAPILTIPPSCSLKTQGDADCNGSVNDADFTIWQTEFLAGGAPYTASFNLDQKVDLIDFEIWRNTINRPNLDVTHAFIGPPVTIAPTGITPTIATTPAVSPTSPIPTGKVCLACSPTPGPSATSAPRSNWCQCDLHVLMQNYCNSSYRPVCIGEFGCECSIDVTRTIEPTKAAVD